MKKTILFLTAGVLTLPAILSAAVREVSFYCPVPAAKPPVIDGVLDDVCWQEAAPYSNTYEYFKPNPGPGLLKNTFKIVYDSQGFYLGIVNYESNTKGLRKSVTNRDNPKLWEDDCAELYIDPAAGGIGYRKFVVNSIGAIADSLRIDGAVMRDDWDGSGWQVKTRINPDSWVIEAYFPWADLGQSAKPGDIWMFCHVRYAWASGKFIGTTSSPGGNYTAAGNFGYLCFLGKGEKVNINAAAAKLAAKLSPPWCLAIGETMLIDKGQGIRQESIFKLINEEKQRFNKALSQLNIPKKYTTEHQKLLKEYRTLAGDTAPTVQTYRSMNLLADKAEQFRWKAMLENNFNL